MEIPRSNKRERERKRCAKAKTQNNQIQGKQNNYALLLHMQNREIERKRYRVITSNEKFSSLRFTSSKISRKTRENQRPKNKKIGRTPEKNSTKHDDVDEETRHPKTKKTFSPLLLYTSSTSSPSSPFAVHYSYPPKQDPLH